MTLILVQTQADAYNGFVAVIRLNLTTPLLKPLDISGITSAPWVAQKSVNKGACIRGELSIAAQWYEQTCKQCRILYSRYINQASLASKSTVIIQNKAIQ